MLDFTGQTAVVTGAGSGIGAQIAEQLLSAGARVLAADIQPSDAPDGAERISCNVSEEQQVLSMIDTAHRLFGSIDLLFNNAGIGSTTNVLDTSVHDWDRVFAVNVRGVFLGIKHALPGMLAQGHGVIVNTASVAGLIGLPDRAAYCASKGAVIALSRQVAIQWAGAGIRCNCICPGTVDSPWVGRLMSQAPDPAQRRRELIARQPLGRLGTPAEIARAALYLASDDAAFITGTELVIDGGILAG